MNLLDSVNALIDAFPETTFLVIRSEQHYDDRVQELLAIFPDMATAKKFALQISKELSVGYEPYIYDIYESKGSIQIFIPLTPPPTTKFQKQLGICLLICKQNKKELRNYLLPKIPTE